MTTFQLRISKTKKKLSDESWLFSIFVLLVLGISIVFMFALRSVSLPASYGIVEGEIPVVPVSVHDPGFHRYKETAIDTLKRSTPTVVLTTKAYYFGDLKAFSTEFSDTANKYAVEHVDDQPQLADLIEQLEVWSQRRKSQNSVRPEDLLVLIPSGNIPMPIVIQVMDGFRNLSRYKKIVLGGGLM